MRSASGRSETTLALVLLLAACAGRPTPPPATSVPGVDAAAERSRPVVKIGRPYQVYGVTYYPVDDRNYDQRGIASWYGPGFHALDTANGERYDQDDLTAAHKTLPMPSWVEVENLDNGRKLTIRINDRGPFVAGRIIDLSRKSAQLLGVDRAGTARVRVRRVYPAGKPKPPEIVAAGPSAPFPAAVPARTAAPVKRSLALAETMVARPVPPADSTLFVQVAALSDPGRVAWLTGFLSAFGNVIAEKSPTGLTRLRLGPYANAAAANAALAQLRAAGYSDTRLVSTKASSSDRF